MSERSSLRWFWTALALVASLGVVLLVVCSSVAEHTLAGLEATDLALQMKCHDLMHCSRRTDELAWGLIDGRSSLVDAVRTLRTEADSLDYNPLTQLEERFPDLSDNARVAVKLIHAVRALLSDEPDCARANVERLRQEFEHVYNCPLPAIHEYSPASR